MTDNTDLFAEYKQGLNDEWRDAFDTLVGQGKSPSVVRATIEYATTIKTQKQAAEEYDTSTVAIRQLQNDIVEAGPIDDLKSTRWSWERTTKMDYLSELADELDWTKGEEYRIEHGDAPVLTRKGWRSIHSEINPENTDN